MRILRLWRTPFFASTERFELRFEPYACRFAADSRCQIAGRFPSRSIRTFLPVSAPYGRAFLRAMPAVGPTAFALALSADHPLATIHDLGRQSTLWRAMGSPWMGKLTRSLSGLVK